MTLLWSAFAGHDISWDVVNHHVYLPFSLVSGRFDGDLFAAGPQSYLNPLGYLPFYALYISGAPSWAIGCLLALGHGLAAWPLWRVTVWLWPDPEDAVWRAVAMIAAWASPVFLLTAGTSSNDPWSMLLLLTGLAGLISAGPLNVVVAGAAIGLALAVKPSNLIFVAPLFVLTAWRLYRRQLTPAMAILAATTAAACTLVFAGPWAYWLWRDFGSPVFPLFNQYFQSPLAPIEPSSSARFAASSAADWLLRPFEMSLAQGYVATDAIAPDLRPALLCTLAGGGLCATLWRFRPSHIGGAVRAAAEAVNTPGGQLGAFVLLCYPLWMLAGANARYGLAMMALLGLLAVKGIQTVLPARKGLIAAAVFLALQLGHYVHAGDHRYSSSRWTTGRFLEVSVAEPLRSSPYLHLTTGVQTFAALAPHLHHQGSMINLTGQWTIPDTGPLADRLQHHLHLWANRTRALIRVPDEWSEALGDDQSRSRLARPLKRFDLAVNWADCLRIDIQRAPPSFSEGEKRARPITAVVLSCGVLRQPADAAFRAEQQRADAVFKALEERCPEYLTPRPMATDAGTREGTWVRRYQTHDLMLTLTESQRVVMNHFRTIAPADLGNTQAILSGASPSPCIAYRQLVVR